MKKKLLQLLCIVFLLTASTMLAGCMPTAYTSDQKTAIENAAKPLILEYLNDNFKGAKAGNFRMCEGDIDSEKYDMSGIIRYWGRCPTYVVEADFEYQDKNYRICVDTNTKDIYTNYYFDDLMKAYDEVMKENLQSMGITGDLVTYNLLLSTKISNDGIDLSEYTDYAPTSTIVNDVVSTDVTPENAKQYISDALLDELSCIHVDSWLANSGNFHVIHYDDTKKLAEIMPGLAVYNIYAVDDSTMDYLNINGEMPEYWELTISEYYFVGSLYTCRQYERFEKDKIIINSPVADLTDSDVPTKTFTPQITYSEKEKTYYFRTCDYEFTYLFFKNPNTFMGLRKIKVGPGYKPNKFKFRDCGEGLYSLDDDYFDYAFKFLGYFQIKAP